MLAVGAGEGCLAIFSLVYHFSFRSPSLWETARYRLKYCLKGPLSPKQPTNLLWYLVCNALYWLVQVNLVNLGSSNTDECTDIVVRKCA